MLLQVFDSIPHQWQMMASVDQMGTSKRKTVVDIAAATKL
jgi:hypothetical protein